MDNLKNSLLVTIENLKKFIQHIIILWNGFSFNIKLAISIYSILFLTSIIYIYFIHIEYSNTGKILWNSYSYKYIDIRPKEDYMSLLKPDGNVITKKIINLDSSNIELSYSIEADAKLILDSIGILNIIETMKVLEYALKKAKFIMLGKNKKFRYNTINVIFKKTNELSKFAGGYTLLGNMYINCEFIKAIYNERTKEDFIKYYIGLFIHEFTHMILYPQYSIATNDIIQISENLCEYIRLVSGYGLNNWYLKKSLNHIPTEKYGPEGSYFIYYMESKYPGFVNTILHFVEPTIDSQTNTEYSTDTLNVLHLKHTGKTLKDNWKEFQNELQ